MSNNISFCALDLETTGLNASTDQIIEIGLQAFTLNEIGQTYTTFVKPTKRIPKKISLLTGITNGDVQKAPSIEKIQKDIRAFIGDKTIIGHNLPFDLSFLSTHGIEFENNTCDTLHFSYMMNPNAPDYTLGGLANYLDISQKTSHRALADSITCMNLFKKVSLAYLDLPTSTAGQIAALHQRSNSLLNNVLTHLLTIKLEGTHTGFGPIGQHDGKDPSSPEGIQSSHKDDHDDPYDLSKTPTTVEEIFRNPSRLSRSISAYEDRDGQMEMALMVEESLKESSNIIIEAGTGIGKSMAYLMPSILHGSKTGQKIVVSTNTINLQDQLMEKDIPAAISVIGINPQFQNDFSFNVLKGSQNYLCKKRLETQLNRTQLDSDQAVFLSKILVWVTQTKTGDKSELNLNRRGHDSLWRRVNADSSDFCGIRHGNCYLRKAREVASSSHLLVVNHSLLMANLRSGMTIIPNYDCLIIDEAHHIEAEATNAFGFQITEESLYEITDRMTAGDSILNTATNLVRNQITSKSELSSLETTRSRINTTTGALKDTVKALFAALSLALYGDNTSSGASRLSQENRIRIISSHRGSGWENVSLLANNLSVQISSTVSDVENLMYKLEGFPNQQGATDLLAEMNNLKSDLVDATHKLMEVTLRPLEDAVYWVNRQGNKSPLAVCMAPAEIATILSEKLYAHTSNIIMTSATLTSNDDFNHFVTRTGFQAASSAVIPSPFPYSESTTLILAKDIPDPRQTDHYTCLAKVILQSAEGAQGKTLCLFTSHQSIRRVYDLIRQEKGQSGLEILAQGISGSTQNLVKRLKEGSNCVVLGTASLWEGIDIKGDALQLLIITRLPFEVPTDPIYQARSETYDNPFLQYALPNAILRFRQGFGRLIRSSTDRGVILVLDSRISTARYGRYFINSLPEMDLSQIESDHIGATIEKWLYQ